MKVNVSQSLSAGTSVDVDITDVESWEDIAQYYVKWDTLHYRKVGSESWSEIGLDSPSCDVIGWKRPDNVHITSEDGQTTYADD